MKEISKNKGITLIALVITIVVLLILAGISIATLTGDKGIISESQKAKEKSEIKSEKEIVQIATFNALDLSKNSEITEENLRKALDKQIKGKYETVLEEGVVVTFKESNRSYLVDVYGDVVEFKQPLEQPETGGTIFNRSAGSVDIKFLKGTSYEVGEANKPALDAKNMIPLNWNGENWVVTDETNWDYSYDETNRKWANAMLSDGTYKAGSVSVGQVVQESDLGSMIVWIPRYAYKITYYESELTYASVSEVYQIPETYKDYFIDFENNMFIGTYPLFKKGEENKSKPVIAVYEYDETVAMYYVEVFGKTVGEVNKGKIVGYSDARGIVDVEGRTPEGMNEPVTSVSVEDNYRPHPAFENGSSTGYKQGEWSKRLTGIWMAKFETTEKGTDGNVTIKPNTVSYSNQTVGAFYTEVQNLGIANSHMAKNSEWGAMAYLTDSKYGRNGTKVTINTSTDTGGGDYVANVNQSTTGNIYGIYDVAGGRYECVAAYVPDGLVTEANSFASIDNTTNNKTTSTQYATAYIKSDSNHYEENYIANLNKVFGEALFETSTGAAITSWYGTVAGFPGEDVTTNEYGAFSLRGGMSNEPISSVFSYHRGIEKNSDGNNTVGYRICFVVK